MAIISNKIYIPESGKQQVELKRFNYKINYRNSLFTIYLPCAKDKPYYNSTTHSYIKLKIDQFLPRLWKNLIKICTISEIIGIVPEELENIIFKEYKDEFYYEHYPIYGEGDLERTSEWLSAYIYHYGTKFNYGYCTSKIFREICDLANLECFPKKFKKESAIFEFRKLENIKAILDKIIEDYKDILSYRFGKWKLLNSHSYKVLQFAKENSPFTAKQFKNKFKNIKSPITNLNSFCNESKSDKGLFLYYNNRNMKYELPEFIINVLKI